MVAREEFSYSLRMYVDLEGPPQMKGVATFGEGRLSGLQAPISYRRAILRKAIILTAHSARQIWSWSVYGPW